MKTMPFSFSAEQSLADTVCSLQVDHKMLHKKTAIHAAGNKQDAVFIVKDPEGDVVRDAVVSVGRNNRCTTSNGFCHRHILCNGKRINIEVWSEFGVKSIPYFAPSRNTEFCDRTKAFNIQY